MGNKSFYDLDYIIEINEQRLEQYIIAQQKNTERFTTLLVIYSALCIFLVPVIQTLFLTKEQYHWSYYCSFYTFCILFIISIVNSVLLLSPEAREVLLAPDVYYKNIKQFYETEGLPPAQADTIIKGSYIVELEGAVSKNRLRVHRKISFYKRAFHFAIISCIPYLYCIWLQIYTEKKVILKKDSFNNLSSFTKTNHICGRENQNSKRSTIIWSER